MTEKELTEMELMLFQGRTSDARIESTWIEQQMTGLLVEEQQLMAAWRLSKAMRDDEKMKSIADAVKKNRDMQSYMSDRLKVIHG